MKKIGYLFIILLISSLIISGCDSGGGSNDSNIESYSLTVQTQDADSILTDVSISINGSNIADEIIGTTNSNGKLSLTNLKGTVTITAVNNDYVFDSVQVTKADSGKTITLTCKPYLSLYVERVQFGPSLIFTVRVDNTSQIQSAARFAIQELSMLNSADFGEEITRNTEEETMEVYILDEANNLLETVVISEDTVDFGDNNQFTGNLAVTSQSKVSSKYNAELSVDSLEFVEASIFRVGVENVALPGATKFALVNSEGYMGNPRFLGELADIYTMTEGDLTLVIFDKNSRVLAEASFAPDASEVEVILTPVNSINYQKLTTSTNDKVSIQAEGEVLASTDLEIGEYREWVPLIFGNFEGLPESYLVMANVVIEYNFAFDNKTLFNEILSQKLAEVDYNLDALDLFFKMPNLSIVDAKTGNELGDEYAKDILLTVNTLYDAEHPEGHSIVNAMADVEVNALPFGTQYLFNVIVHEVVGIEGVDSFTIFDIEETNYPTAVLGEEQSNYSDQEVITLFLLGESNQHSGDYNITFQVNAVTEGESAVMGAMISIDNRSGQTDSSGQNTFYDFAAGSYEYTITSTNYTTVTDTIEVIDADVIEQVYLSPKPQEGNRVHFSGVLFYDTIQNGYTEIPYVANGYYNEFGLDTDNFVGSGDYHDNNLAFPEAVATTFDGIAIDEGTRLIIYSNKNFEGEILLDVYGPQIINNELYRDASQVSDFLTKTFEPEALNNNFPPETRSFSSSNMHNWSYGSCRIRTSSDPDYEDVFTSSAKSTSLSDIEEQNSSNNTKTPAGY